MTARELSLHFDRLYDDATRGAPGVNEYEKSVFLTIAQRELYEEYIARNKTDESIEYVLKEKIKPYVSEYNSVLNSFLNNKKVKTLNTGDASQSIFFQIPDDVHHIEHEHIESENNKIVQVAYIGYDQISRTVKSPFRNMLRDRARRTNVFRTTLDDGNTYNVAEIMYGFDSDPSKYVIRYFDNIDPIITTDFESDPDLSGMNLTIEGINTVTESELDRSVHDRIVEKAVEKAVLAYRENSLANNVQLNQQ